MFGKKSANSLASWAASVLLCAMTSDGRPTFSMTRAMVCVLPDPVTPSSVCASSPASKPAESFSMACGWSPVGRYSLFTSKFVRVSMRKSSLGTA